MSALHPPRESPAARRRRSKSPRAIVNNPTKDRSRGPNPNVGKIIDLDSTDQHYRVAIFSWEDLHSIRVGELAPTVTKLCRALARRGHEIHLFTRMGEGQPDYDLINRVHHHRCSFHPGNNILEFARNMCGAMVDRFHATEAMVGKFDVVHGHDWMVIDALHDLKNEGYSTVLTFHSTEYSRNGERFGDWWECREISGKEWYGAYIADRVATTSRITKSELMYLYEAPKWKVDVIPNCRPASKYHGIYNRLLRKSQ